MVTAGGGSSIGERGSLLPLTPGPGTYGALGAKKQPLLEMATGEACLNAGDKESEVKEKLENRGS